jgi:hypothetical protein
MTSAGTEDKWTKTIQQFFEAGKLTSHQCIVYNKNSYAKTNEEKCGCQRPIRHHSFDGDSLRTNRTQKIGMLKNIQNH